MMMIKIEMMEAKLRFALCALLLVNTGSADEAANATTVQKPEPTTSGSSVTQLPSMSPAVSNFSTEAPETGSNSTNTTGTFSTPVPHTTQSSLNHSTTLHDAPTSSVPSNNSAQNETSSPTSVSSPNATTTTVTTAAAATVATAPGTFPTSPSNASSSGNATTSQPSTNTNRSSSATTKPSPITTMAVLNVTTTHAESSPQLTMQGSKSHDSPGLDPLLVGLVSAFVITAIVITLLLFLKFRRRQSEPQFHRLQDLPMDDMMEETPLSMYSY